MSTRTQRIMANLFEGWFQLRRRFPSELLDDMTAAIADGERTHLGEVRFAVESRLPLPAAWAGLDASERARQVFGQLGVWDTEHNCGVLIYVLMSEHRIEIVADRGIARRVKQEEWTAICGGMRENFAAGQWRAGALHGITQVHALLAQHFPSHGRARPDELPDRPVLL
ncbi:TPM domain-containing protein [Dyella flagellata]|uniref:Membrane protein n=1 Tax=Dyella flagellata TaxID=1867833 RepID=A0ABQ5XDF6_9GAMM|nr:TPM domain-containing protein [Dyella flagellata]GLQ89699.1 membrane protein [Dyella flagellata]